MFASHNRPLSEIITPRSNVRTINRSKKEKLESVAETQPELNAEMQAATEMQPEMQVAAAMAAVIQPEMNAESNLTMQVNFDSDEIKQLMNSKSENAVIWIILIHCVIIMAILIGGTFLSIKSKPKITQCRRIIPAPFNPDNDY